MTSTDTELTEQSLDTAMDSHRDAELRGRIRGRIVEAAQHHDVEQDVARFETAVDQQWPLVFAMATSGAHGWQVSTDGDGLTLDEHAYARDVGPLVFENGWVMLTGAQWFRDEDLVASVAELQDRREEPANRRDEKEQDALAGDDRLRRDEDATGEPMDGWWVFEPTAFVGRPPAAVAHAAGFDAASEETVVVTTHRFGGTEETELAPGETTTVRTNDMAVTVERRPPAADE